MSPNSSTFQGLFDIDVKQLRNEHSQSVRKTVATPSKMQHPFCAVGIAGALRPFEKSASLYCGPVTITMQTVKKSARLGMAWHTTQKKEKTDLDEEGHPPAHAGAYDPPKDVPPRNTHCGE